MPLSRFLSRAVLLAAVLSSFVMPSATLAQQADAPPLSDPAQHARDMAAGLKLFTEQVRPLLAERCLVCHGGGQTLGDFDLSTREALLASGKLGDSAADSRLLKLILHEEEPFMPFQQEKLSAEAVDAITRWVDLGAPYDEPLADSSADAGQSEDAPMEVTEEQRSFWSFRPLGQAAPPAAGDSSWAASPIDHFIRQKLESKGLTPNAAADRRTLIRRAYLNLLGLPPGPEEVEAFVSDASPDAYEKLVDGLFDSPHYGERWARHWMDIARFGESDGFEQDFDRPYSFHYRDFLIRAFNEDMPYDRFVRWQLAGDELAPDNPQAMIATGFLGGGPFPTQITEAEFETARYDELDDMIGTMGTAMLGLTVGCARCHDHKYDPIPNRDYYRLASVFGRTIRSEIDYDPGWEEYLRAKEEWDKEHAELEAARAEYDRKRLSAPFEKWLKRAAKGAKPAIPADQSWQVLDLTEYKSKGGAVFEKLDDGSLLASGPNTKFDTYTFTAETDAMDIASIRVEALTHLSLYEQGPGRSVSGQFLMRSFRVDIQSVAVGEIDPIKTEFAAARATDHLDGDAGSVEGAANIRDTFLGWTLSPSGIGADQAAVFDFAKPIGFEDGTRLIISMRFPYNTQFALGRPRLSISTESGLEAAVGGGIPQKVVEGFAVLKRQGKSALLDKQRAALFDWFGRSDKRRRDHGEKLRAHRRAKPLSPKTKMQVTSEGFSPKEHAAEGRGYPHYYEKTYFLNRGDANNKGDVAEPGFLQVLMRGGHDETVWRVSPPSDWKRTGFTRASLARWMTDADNGGGALLARVIVNRLWHHHFGRGIAASPSDLGMQGERPTHPELLDWLARDLVDHGWRLKRLHKLIMMSAVYQVSAAYDAEKAAADIGNLYRWRWTPRRLEAEAVRDSLLQVSGLLDPTIYGPGSLRTEMQRRSIYFFIKRSEPIPSMMLFDWPEHLVGIGRRPSTTIAPQALMFLNSPQTRRYAEGLAGRLRGRKEPAAITEAYRIAYGREPTPAEIADGEQFLDQQRRTYKGKGRADSATSALADYCQTLLGLNEFLYIR